MQLSSTLGAAVLLTAAGVSFTSAKPTAPLRQLAAPVDNAAIKYTNDAFGYYPSTGGPSDPVTYYENRSRAVELAFDSNWKEAQPLLRDLSAEYPDDGDIWYLLALSYMQTEAWAAAIPAFESTIALGTALKGVPSGSSPSNDIMMKVAEAYAALGDSPNAIIWAEKALAARYDDRPFLADKPHFEDALSKGEYRQILGSDIDQGLSRDELWRADLRFLVSELRRLHVDLHHTMSAQEFNEHIADIEARIPALSDQEIVFSLMELVGGLGNGHNLIIPTNGAKGSFSRLPVEFYWFSDGLFLVDASEAYEHLIGSEVTAIGDMPIEDALARTAVLNARNNEMQHLWLAPYYVSLPEVLKGLGVVDDTQDIALTVVAPDDKKKNIILSGSDWTFTGFPKLPKLKGAEQPRYLSKSDRRFWSETLPEHDAIFVQFNWVNESKEETLAAFSENLRQQFRTSGVDNLILDIRHNPGGNGSILPPFLRALIYFEAAGSDKKLYVIAGRGTYSAAHNLLTNLDGLTDAVMVGEPSGTRPNEIAEAGWFKLPYSGVMGLVSSQFHQASSAEDHRIWIAPDIPAPLSSSDYFSGRDPALEAIFDVIKATKSGEGEGEI